MVSFSFAAAALLAAAPAVYATYGIDLATAVSVADAQCLVKNDHVFGVLRGWHSYGAFDPYVCSE
jgi:hypothetical protein